MPKITNKAKKYITLSKTLMIIFGEKKNLKLLWECVLQNQDLLLLKL